ncbi:hypothetical protein [Actinocrispum wychmicini]|uniref:Uncharacterized protein n=1 Tax=Actinocrispum wychmicini TaxID=1213861 RepID=A0A4R2JUL6_9PSEU|nr:hypothetical protein [Actinocrispum wychmicini]TCO62897.1 hypothetical protein EV192_1021037 [Actinocrispum wychmicini]
MIKRQMFGRAGLALLRKRILLTAVRHKYRRPRGTHKADPPVRTYPVRPGLTFHGQRHSHKAWMIADGIPETAQARRLDNRIAETDGHVAPEVQRRLMRCLERRWHNAHATTNPALPAHNRSA